MNLSKTILLTPLALFTAFTLQGQPKEQLIQEDLNTYLTTTAQQKGFSGEVLVAKGEDILFQKAIGFASVENQLDLSVGAKYRIASLTKTFTGTLIALAQEEEKLHYNDPASRYIEGLSDKFKHITIHQLLTHTSGLPHHEAIQDYWQSKSKLQMTKAQAIDEINRVVLLSEPGEQRYYSSLGYYLLAVILENIYDGEFKDILRNKILNPLQMEGVGAASSLELIDGMASGYHLVADDSLVVAPYRNYSMLKGAGDMYATAPALLKWGNSWLSNPLPNEKNTAQIFTPQPVDRDVAGRRYGYGWFIESGENKKYFHGGGTWGYSSFMALYPDNKISIIILSNISTLPTESMASDIENIVYRKPFTMPKVEMEVSDDVVDLQIYSGDFISASGKMTLKIMSNENGLFAQLAGNPAFEIYPKGNHQFFGKRVEVLISFELNGTVVDGLTAERMGQTFHFKKQ